MSELLYFAETVVTVHDWGTEITWPDGTMVPGAPEDTDAYRKTADELGYGSDTLSLCREHELLHVALCRWLGVESPVMLALRYPDIPGTELQQLEENAVLAVQKFARAMEIDLIQTLHHNL